MYPVTDTFTRIKNACQARHERVIIPFSRLRLNIVKLLEEAAFVGSIQEKGDGVRKYLDVTLRYTENASVFNDFRTISKPSKRIYVSASDINKSLRGGVFIISTQKGLMVGEKARKMKVGGELLCEVW